MVAGLQTVFLCIAWLWLISSVLNLVSPLLSFFVRCFVGLSYFEQKWNA